jgi:hypothetical protein
MQDGQAGWDLEHALEESLAPAWERERRRALRAWALATAARVALALGALVVLSLPVCLMTGATLPWAFDAVIAVMMTAGAFSQKEGREHLRP